jgi:uncharacterized protein
LPLQHLSHLFPVEGAHGQDSLVLLCDGALVVGHHATCNHDVVRKSAHSGRQLKGTAKQPSALWRDQPALLFQLAQAARHGVFAIIDHPSRHFPRRLTDRRPLDSSKPQAVVRCQRDHDYGGSAIENPTVLGQPSYFEPIEIVGAAHSRNILGWSSASKRSPLGVRRALGHTRRSSADESALICASASPARSSQMPPHMLPPSLLAYDVREGTLVPHYLTPRDEPWIRLLIDELDALVGRTRGDTARILAHKMPEIAKDHDVPIAAVRGVRHLLERLWLARPAAGVPSREIRRVVFELGRDRATPREEVLRRAARVLGIKPDQVSEGLFADNSSERRLSAPIGEPTARDLIDGYNMRLVQEFLLRSEQLVLHLGAHAAPVLRVLKHKGLMYSFDLATAGAVITLPGPVSLFRQTLRYGRALAGLFPAVAAVPDWSLDAKCLMGGRVARFHADSGDPIVATAPKDTDNALERRLFSDFRRLGSGWSMFPAAQVLRASGAMFFPDVVFERGMDRILIEVVGFHTAPYLAAKLGALRSAGLSSVLLCVDDSLACSERSALEDDALFHFQKRIHVGRLLRTIERLAARPDTAPDSDQPSS